MDEKLTEASQMLQKALSEKQKINEKLKESQQ